MRNIRTDLAIEAREMYQEEAKQEIPGVDVSIDRGEDYTITRVQVLEDVGVKIMGKPKGNYVTIESPGLKDNDRDLYEDISRALAGEMIKLVKLNDKSVILVVGLGNRGVTPDALGPKVVEHLMVTRHIKEYLPDQIDEGVRSVCALAPGVLGITGIETSEIIRGVVDRIKPDLVIAVDALASRKMSRVSTTIQIADTGINPGSGVGNNRKELSKESMGVPVIAIGVPTVVDAATMANDTIDAVVEVLLTQSEKGGQFYNMLKEMEAEDKYKLISEILANDTSNIMVTPKEIDRLIMDISKIIANGLNIALHPSIEMDDIDRFIH